MCAADGIGKLVQRVWVRRNAISLPADTDTDTTTAVAAREPEPEPANDDQSGECIVELLVAILVSVGAVRAATA